MNHRKISSGWWQMITLTCEQRYMVLNNGTSFSSYQIKKSFNFFDNENDILLAKEAYYYIYNLVHPS